MPNKYYEILGISGDASLSEIKRAFRNKAKALHPDVNKSQNAHEQFILLLEAYDYLIHRKTGKTESHQRWQDSEAARARHRAEYFSKINYEKFVNSDYYKTVTSLSTIFEHLGFFIAAGIFIPLPVILTVLFGLYGFIISLLIMLITLPVTRQAIKSRSSINVAEFFRAVAFVTKIRLTFIITILSILNLFIILKVGFQTMIPFSSMILIFVLSMSFVFFFTYFDLKKSAKSSAVISFCYCPFILNLLFVINFLFSTNPGWETYSFMPEHSILITGQGDKIAYIRLENNKYATFNGIRVFADFNSMKDAKKILYKFEDGLFGIRVMKDFKFYR